MTTITLKSLDERKEYFFTVVDINSKLNDFSVIYILLKKNDKNKNYEKLTETQVTSSIAFDLKSSTNFKILNEVTHLAYLQLASIKEAKSTKSNIKSNSY